MLVFDRCCAVACFLNNFFIDEQAYAIYDAAAACGEYGILKPRDLCTFDSVCFLSLFPSSLLSALDSRLLTSYLQRRFSRIRR